MAVITLYGTPLSLYTGKARSYFINAGLDYQEVTTATRRYHEVVKPASGTRSIPVIETEQGDVLRDGTQIIDHYEAASGGQFSPQTTKQNVLSRLFDVIGSEGLLRPAMHYRWDFPELNFEFVKFHFESNIPAELDRKEVAEKVMGQMRNAGHMFGAVPENFSAIEAHYEGLLEKLNAHFAEQPYLFGNRAAIGDFGMMAPLYAHLGRDPAPLALMQAKAIRVCRWVERMNRPEPDIGEMKDPFAEGYLADDEIPETLKAVLRHIALDFVPETLAAAKTINEWLAEHQPEVGSPIARGVGLCEFDLADAHIKALAQPYRFFLLKRVQNLVAELGESEQTELRALFSECGVEAVLDCRLDRSTHFDGNLEVWD